MICRHWKEHSLLFFLYKTFELFSKANGKLATKETWKVALELDRALDLGTT